MPNPHFDVIVIGAGNAGLTAALRLQKAGKNVLLIEKNILPGGASTSYVRGRFEFEASLHEFCMWGTEDNKGHIREDLESLGLDTEWISFPETFRHIILHDRDNCRWDFSMPSGWPQMIESIEKEVPGSKSSLIRFHELIRECADAVQYVDEAGEDMDPKYVLTHYPSFLRCAAEPVSDVFDACGIPPRAQDILSTYWGYFGKPMDDIILCHYGSGLDAYVQYGPAIPKLTSHANSVSLINRYYEAGGKALFHTPVTHVRTTDGGVACGVDTPQGSFDADYILSNLNPSTLYGSLMDASAVPVAAIQRHHLEKMGMTFCCICMGLDISAEELGIHNYSIFISDSYDTHKVYSEMNTLDRIPFCIFNCNNVINPTFSPEGTCVCSITTPFTEDIWGQLPPEKYVATKEAYAARVIQHVETVLGISLREHIEELDISTPVTMARYMGTPQGTTYGYEASVWDSVLARNMDAKRYNLTPHLYTIGACDVSAHGSNMCYTSGIVMADRIIAKLNQNKEENV